MRALLLVLDGLGVGNAPDAAAYNDRGADTLGHLFLHHPSLELPNLFSLGLREILSGAEVTRPDARACYGRIRAASPGKELRTAHREIAGAILEQPFARYQLFPAALVDAIAAEAKIGFIGNRAGSGPALLEEFGKAHLASGYPILYTSANSVMQIAAHEQIIPWKRLYEICRIARRHCDAFRIERVIARPFTGVPGNFDRSQNGRMDFPIVPPRTFLNALAETGVPVVGLGKVATVFGPGAITESHPAPSNREALQSIETRWNSMQDGLLFANLPDFDSIHGPNRDLAGFAHALAEFDAWLGGFLQQIDPEDLVILTASHGHDPTFRGQDRTREELPMIVMAGGKTGPLPARDTFADIAATLSAFFELQEPWPRGKSLFEF